MSDLHADVTTKVIALAAEQGGVEPATVAPATHFVNDLNFDSLDTVEFAMALEDEFELPVPDDVAPTLMTVGHVIEYVVAHVPKASPTVADLK